MKSGGSHDLDIVVGQREGMPTFLGDVFPQVLMSRKGGWPKH